MVKNKPEIRFKGFEDVWEEKKVKDITTTLSLSYSGVNRPKQEDYKQEGDYMYVPTGEINFNNINSTKTYLNKDFVSKYNYKIIPEGVLLMAKNASPTAGKVAITNKESIIINTTFIFQMKELIIYQKFLYHFFTNNYKHITSLAEGSTQKDLKTGTVLNYKINFPSLPEQERIGNFLSRIDSRIDSLKKEKIGLENYKKALLQKMFPKKGENKPEIRFKVFTDDWEEVRVGDIYKVTRGKNYIAKIKPISSDRTAIYKYPIYTSQVINDGVAGYYDKYTHKDSITCANVGEAGTLRYREGKFYCTDVCGVLLNDEGYSNLCMSLIIGKKTKSKVTNSAGRGLITSASMKSIKVNIPSLLEQERISTFFSNLDKVNNGKKEGINKEIEYLKDYKKGILQKIFIKKR